MQVVTSPKPKKKKKDVLSKGFEYLESMQAKDGSWHGDYGGPLFLIPGYVFAAYATNTALDAGEKKKLGAYLQSVQNPDGGFGLHVEGKSYLFNTVLSYVAWRLMGVPADAAYARRAREWIRRQAGGALGIPSWGKMWLCIMGLYEYDGVMPVLPELWLTPEWVPVHPSKMWCHTRVVYLPMSYLYGRRWRVPETDLLEDLRAEIYDRSYEEIRWEEAGEYIIENDLYTPHSRLLKIANKAQAVIDRLMPQRVRDLALRHTMDHLKHDQVATNFVDLGPVNKMLNAVACYADDPASEHTQRALSSLGDYLFEGEDGLKVQGYASSQLWDTAFTLRALEKSGKMREFLPMAKRAAAWIDATQIRKDVEDREEYYRDPTKGGWPFSDARNGYPTPDCTAEGIKSMLAMERYLDDPMEKERFFDSVDLLLFMQNDNDGGWSSYEKRRGNFILELINPSEVFGDIMTDYSYVELTASAMEGLIAVRDRYGREMGNERLVRIERALERGDAYLRSIQREDGSWEGSWGICFVYGTMFGINGLRAHGASADDPAIARAVKFILSKQNDDGGWGESYLSSQTRQFVAHPDGSQVVMTSWAVLALIESGRPEVHSAVERGVALLKARQLSNGDWPREGIAGVFNRNCMIHYRFYRNYFPLWAIASATHSAV